MDVKEKLVELLQNAKAAMKSENLSCDIARNMFVVDFMMANGVTVQEWISVDDRLPDKDGAYLVTTNGVSGLQNVKTRWFAKDGEMVDAYDLAGQKDVWYLYDSECGYVSIKTVTQWMPLPPEPKKEGLQ